MHFFDLGPDIMAIMKGRDVCEIFRVCRGHYNEEGNAIIAQILNQHLNSNVPGEEMPL